MFLKSSFICAAICTLALSRNAANAQVGSQRLLTTHVPAPVTSRLASLVGPLPTTQRLSLSVSLPLRDEAGLKTLLTQIYDPKSANYHKYLSVSEFTSRYAPTAEDTDAVVSYFKSNGFDIDILPANRLVIAVTAPVDTIQRALYVTLNTYQHPTEHRTFFAPDREPTVALAVPLLHISGLDDFTLSHPKIVHGTTSKGSGSGPGGQLLGSDARHAYYGSGSLKGAGQSVALYEEAGFEMSDVKTYFKNVSQSLNVPVHGVSVNHASLGCAQPSCDDSEQDLDIEMAISMAPALKELVVYVGSSSNRPSILNRIASDNTSKQISCSWGWGDDESALDPIFEEMAVQGQSMFVATGDGGSATPAGIVWPADDPWIIAVGGTNLTITGPGGGWESETGWGGSAGGHSKNGIPIPFYQPPAVDASNHGSKTLRNYPDVAAAASGFYSCYDASCSTGNGGTSYAAPQWAGFTALINEEAAKHHQAAVGFANPAIYAIGKSSSQYAAGFNDIKSGSNGGFTAVKGYDLVTGWGTPRTDLVDELSGVALPHKPLVTIRYHQVGACNGYATSFGVTSAGPNAALVIFGIESIDNTKGSGTFKFDPSKLFVHQLSDEVLSPGLVATIPSSRRVTSVSVSKGHKHTFSHVEFGAVAVSTKDANGAVEANRTRYELSYKTSSTRPQIVTDKTDATRKSWPSTLDCSTIKLK